MNVRRVTDILFVIFLPIVFILSSLQITTNFTDSRHVGPDEEMRYFMPEFIYNNHRLPTGYETETWGNWSYGFYPQFLGAIVSTVFMSIASILQHDNEFLIRAARLASVLFGVIAAIAVRNTARLMFIDNKHKHAISNLAMILFALLPQVAFLSSYINNDIVGLAGVSIIIYACLHVYRHGLKLFNAICYAIGASTALLGYLNSYGFVLVGFIFIFIQLIDKFKTNRTYYKKYILVSIGLIVLIAGPFFIRNCILYNGDIFGLTTFHSEYQRWLDSGGFSMQSPYNKGLFSLLSDTHWMVDTVTSLTFGYFASWGRGVTSVQYWPYYLGFVTISACAGVASRELVANKKRSLLVGLIVAGAVITVTLALYYTLAIDYQPQGRYVVYLLVPGVLGSVYGINYLLQKVIRPKYISLAIYSICLAYFVLYISVVYSTLWA